MTRATAAIVLAAGLATRFGGQKLLTELDGRPLLQHVLDALAALPLEPVVVVLGREADALEAALRWRSELTLRNTHPEDGLSSSLKLGFAAVQRAAAVERVLVVLGDQPKLSGAHVRPLLDASADEAKPIVVPRYDDGQAGNPVLLERAAWPLVGMLHGDRGMSQLFSARPLLVRYVDVPETNPDVDTPADLARLSRAAGPARCDRTADADRSRP